MLSGLTVVIPAYNEQDTLEEVVRQVLAKLPSLAQDYEVLIVNDGSKDDTRSIAEGLASENEFIKVINHPFNIGYGGTQKSGILAAQYEYLTIIPSDGQFDVDDLQKFVDAADGFDIVLGCKALQAA